MSRLFDGTDDILTNAGRNTSLEFLGAFTVSFWYEPNGALAAFDYLLVYDDRVSDRGSWAFLQNSGVQFGIDHGAAPVSTIANSGSNPSSGWHHVCGAYDGGGVNASQQIWFDGTSSDSDRPDANDPVYDAADGLRLATWKAGVLASACNMAEVCVWNVGLSDDEILSLSKNYAPSLIRPSAIVVYYPLIGRLSPEPDYGGGAYDLTVTGSVVAAHSPVISPAHPMSGVAAAAAPPARDLMIISKAMKYAPLPLLAGGMGLAWVINRRNKLMRGENG